jgi:UDP-glucose-4-epimerase GalE
LRHGVKDLVFSSSCAVYGRPDEKLVSENHPMVPLSPYAQSKAQVEAALTVAAARGLCSVSLRYFNAAGADETAEIGEAHAPETHLLPLAVDAALGLGSQLTVLGHDHPTPDGSCIRDFVHVTDLADAHIRALRWLRTAASTGVHEQFNVGSGSGYSVLEVIAETGRIARRPVPYIIGANRPGDSPRLVGNISKSMRELGWQPTRGLALQIEDTLRWRRRMPRS